MFKKLFVTCCIVILFGEATVFADDLPFKVNKENSPSTIIQRNPVIWDYGEQLAVTWEDYRLGNNSTFMQLFNHDLSRVNINYKTDGWRDLLVNEDRVFHLVTEISEFGQSDMSYNHLIAKLKTNEGNLIFNTELRTEMNPFCGTGWLGQKSSCTLYLNDFIVADHFGGYLRVFRIDEDGEIVSSFRAENELESVTCSNLTVTANSNNYLVTWVSTQYDYDELSLNYIVFDQNDSLIYRNIGGATIPAFHTRDIPLAKLDSFLLNDSSFQIIYVGDSLNLDRLVIDKSNFDIIEQESFNFLENNFLPKNELEVKNFSVSKNKSGGKLCLITLFRYDYSAYLPTYFNYLFDIDSITGAINMVATDIGMNIITNEQLVTDEDQNFYASFENNNDVFIHKLKNFEIIDSVKVNDDLVGSNEHSPSIERINDELICYKWRNEKDYKARIFSTSFGLENDIYTIDSDNIVFFRDGFSVNYWTTVSANGKRSLGRVVRDSDFKIFLDDTLVDNKNAYFDANGKVLSDNNFYEILYSVDKIILKKYNNRMQLTHESELRDTTLYPNQKIMEDEGVGFWLWFNRGFVIKYNYNLEVIAPKKYVGFTSTYLGNNHFANLEYDSLGSFIKIKNIISDSTISKIRLYELITYVQLHRLKNDELLLTYVNEGELFAQGYKLSGEEIKPSQKIILNDNQIATYYYSKVIDNNIYFVWSEKNDNFSNYDIYSSIISIDKITSAESIKEPISFQLMPNYPNPFNPSTVISFSIPSGLTNKNVELAIYNIMGELINVLVDEVLPSGNYKTKWNGTNSINLPVNSGIYFYRLQVGDQKLVGKMILIK